MNKFIYGFASAIISMIAVVVFAWFLVYIYSNNESRLTHIESSAFRMKDNSVLIFTRDYSKDKSNHLTHFIIVVDFETKEPLIQIIPREITDSDRFVLGVTDDNNVVLYSPFYERYIKYSFKDKGFEFLKTKERINENIRILIDSQKHNN